MGIVLNFKEVSLIKLKLCVYHMTYEIDKNKFAIKFVPLSLVALRSRSIESEGLA